MAELNGLPVYQITFKEDLSANSGIDFISLVDYPAIESNWVTMANTKEPLRFSANKEKQILCGAIMIPDKPIYRYDADGIGEYYVVFNADTIEKLVRKFQATQKTININYQHLKNSQVNNAVIQEIWLTGENDKSKDLGFDLPKGSAFVCAHIGDSKFWDEEVKSKNVMGFSIEGFLDMEMKKLKQHKMSKQNFSEHKLADNNGAVFVDGEIAVDNYVFSSYPSVTLVDGKKQVTQYPCWQETIVLEDGTILTLKDSKILKIDKKQTMSKDKFATAKTETGVEVKTDSEMFEVGSEVYIEVEGEKQPAPNGTHTLDNGMIIEVLDGKITSIEEVMTEEEIAVIQKAMKPVIDALNAQIIELKAQLDAKPAGKSATDSTDSNAGKTLLHKSAKAKVYQRLADIRKKSKEINN